MCRLADPQRGNPVPVLPGEFVISQDCVATVADELDLRLPATMSREPLYFDRDERAAVRDAANRELAEMGLSDGRGAAAELVESLQVLCRGNTEFYGFIGTTERKYNLHVAARGQDAVFAAFTAGEILLRPARAEGLVSELLAELPEAQPAGGRSVSAPEADIQPPSAHTQATGGGLRGDARRLRELLTRPHTASGKLHAAARVGVDARRLTSNDPVVFMDAEDGRWMAYATDNGAGARHVTASSGRTDAIAGRLSEVHQALLSARR